VPDLYRNWRMAMLTAAFVGAGLFLASIIFSFVTFLNSLY